MPAETRVALVTDDRPLLFRWREAVLNSDLPPTTRHVLLTLGCHMAKDGGDCFPSTRTLARETGRSRRTVEKHLRQVAGEWIERREVGQGRGWRRTEYRPLLPDAAGRGEVSSPPNSEGGEVSSPPEGGRGETDDAGVGKSLPTRGSKRGSTTHMGGEGEVGGEAASPPTWPAPSDLPSEDGTGHLEYPEAFERIWDSYPRHRGKKAAYRKVRSLVQDGANPEQLREAAEKYRRRMEREGRDVQHMKLARTFFGPDDWWREELERAADDGTGEHPDGREELAAMREAADG